MNLNQLIKDAAALAVYNNGDIPLMLFGAEVDITFTEKIGNGNHYIEVNYVQTPKEELREIKRVSVTPMGRDCTQGYVVRGADGMKVRDFIAYICNEYDNEHGDFSIKLPNIISSRYGGVKYGWNFLCNYNNGRIYANNIFNDNFEKAMNLTINNVKASGSWERMDYEIDCENKES